MYYAVLCSTGTYKGVYKERKPTIAGVFQDLSF